MSAEELAGPTYEVTIEGTIYPWDKGTISVPEVRELGGMPAGAPVLLVNLADNTERALADDAVHDVVAREPGKPLVKRIAFRRG
jgi:hypothetical protein